MHWHLCEEASVLPAALMQVASAPAHWAASTSLTLKLALVELLLSQLAAAQV